jgi:1,4-alpha-glucan branching enzyme
LATRGYLSLVLHAHLPYVFEADERHHLEERWFYEAMAESYLPLLNSLYRLAGEGVPFRLTLSVSPTLLAMLANPVMAGRFDDYLDRLIQLAGSECHRTRDDEQFNRLAHFYLERFRSMQFAYRVQYRRDLLGALARLHEKGQLELITTCATHGYLPLMKTREAVRMQLATGIKAFAARLGFAPRGIWLPECGYFPGLDEVLSETGVKYTFVDTHGLRNAFPAPRNDVYAPVRTEAGVAFFARDPETSAQVWSMESGYPGDSDYREYYRDIGFDLDETYLERYLPYNVRVNTGIKYYRVTGKGRQKELYSPERALRRAREHAANFHFNRTKQLEHLVAIQRQPPVVTAMYDAELFGHWWFEGPDFLEEVFRLTAEQAGAFALTVPSRYLDEYGPAETVSLYHSSWGEGGYSRVWLNPANDWLYSRYHQAENSLVAYDAAGRKNGSEERIRKLAATELLLAQSSDWAFMIYVGTTAEYARQRALRHLDNFTCLEEMMEKGEVDLEFLNKLENRVAGLFPGMDDCFAPGPAFELPRGFTTPFVLMLSWEYPPQVMGGLSRHVDDLSQALAKAGQPVSVLTSLSEGSSPFEMNGLVSVYRVAPYQQAGQEIDFYKWVIQLNLVFYNLAQKIVPINHYSVIHAHDWLVAPAALALCKTFQLPLVATIHATEFGRNNGLHTPLQHLIHSHEQQLVREADRIICCSRFMAQEVRRLFDTQQEKILVIENGVRPDKVSAPKLTGPDRRRYAGDDEELLFFVGRLVKEKGVEVLLAALARVFAVKQKVRAVIAGKGPLLHELEEQAGSYGIRERIVFTGFLTDEERNRLLATADLVIFPSLYEPFGIVALEAMAVGAPVIVSDVGGMSEVVEHGADGWKVPSGNPAALSVAILMLLDDRKLRLQLGNNARNKTIDAYSWDELAAKTLLLYQDVWQQAKKNILRPRRRLPDG